MIDGLWLWGQNKRLRTPYCFKLQITVVEPGAFLPETLLVSCLRLFSQAELLQPRFVGHLTPRETPGPAWGHEESHNPPGRVAGGRGVKKSESNQLWTASDTLIDSVVNRVVLILSDEFVYEIDLLCHETKPSQKSKDGRGLRVEGLEILKTGQYDGVFSSQPDSSECFHWTKSRSVLLSESWSHSLLQLEVCWTNNNQISCLAHHKNYSSVSIRLQN